MTCIEAAPGSVEEFLDCALPFAADAYPLELVDLPVCYLLCERIDSDPMWLDGFWSQAGHEETALQWLSDAWLYDRGEEDER
ncbi:hypothetical protein [Streptomyces sp. MBT65]|uniref:hypothetical protein n=1 Tax=Streptomyces sp. MBT65 TaxID=1488395 RepID=UPI001F3F578E|nr:hypothetical protein [Streptomyces sp. MBT65]